tara:strand:+ start:2809 stop:3471 length:663 start_codon:yes stop_codon:yes gene_type:complete
MVLHATDRNNNQIAVRATAGGKLTIIDEAPKNYILSTSASGAAVYGGETAPLADINNRAGWLFKKTLADAAKFNYFYYGQGSHAITLGDIKSLCSNVVIDTWTNIQNAPFFVVYTKPTGVGDAGAWYHSKRAYVLEASKKILLGEPINIYAISEPVYTYNCDRNVKLGAIVDTGTPLGSEEILTISLHSDSAAPINTQILIKSLALELNDGSNTYFNLIT